MEGAALLWMRLCSLLAFHVATVCTSSMRYSFQIAHVRSLRIDLFVAALARAVPPAEPNVEDKKRSRPGSSYSLVAKGNEVVVT